MRKDVRKDMRECPDRERTKKSADVRLSEGLTLKRVSGDGERTVCAQSVASPRGGGRAGNVCVRARETGGGSVRCGVLVRSGAFNERVDEGTGFLVFFKFFCVLCRSEQRQTTTMALTGE